MEAKGQEGGRPSATAIEAQLGQTDVSVFDSDGSADAAAISLVL